MEIKVIRLFIVIFSLVASIITLYCYTEINQIKSTFGITIVVIGCNSRVTVIEAKVD